MIENQNHWKKKRPQIVFTFGLCKDERVEIKDEHVVIGRDPLAGIVLDSPYVSRKHAEILFEGGYWFITDLNSKNGVFRNMNRIPSGEKTLLSDGDQIQIGSVSAFEFHDPEETIHQSELRWMTPGLWLDEDNVDVYVCGQRLDPPLSPQQFSLLAALVHENGNVMTHDEIAEVLWPEAAGGTEKAAVDNAISRLRARLSELDEAHDYIDTVRGVGRRFVQRKTGQNGSQNS